MINLIWGCLLINGNDTIFYKTEKKCIKGYRFLFLYNKYGKQLLDAATETGLDVLKTAPNKVVHKEAEAAG